MKTVKAKIKGTNAILEGSVCDDSFFVSIDHDTFERYDLEELEICKESLHIPETCKENPDSLTLKEVAYKKVRETFGNDMVDYGGHCQVDASKAAGLFIAGAEWQKGQDQPITCNSLKQEWLRYVDRRKKECGGELPFLGEYGWLQIARHFAEWQKSQMLKDAEECELVCIKDRLAAILPMKEFQWTVGDKVRIIVLKAEEK